MVALPLANPADDAETVTGWVPSRIESSTGLMPNVAAACPAAIVTDAGTVACVASLLASATVSGCHKSAFCRVTVPVTEFGPAFSATDETFVETVRPGAAAVLSMTQAFAKALETWL